MAYTYKVWIVDGKEHFEYGNGQTRKKDFPFAESLMKLLYLDIWSFADLFEGMGKSIVKLYETKEQQYSDDVLSALNTVAKSTSILNCCALTGGSVWKKPRHRATRILWSCYQEKSCPILQRTFTPCRSR